MIFETLYDLCSWLFNPYFIDLTKKPNFIFGNRFRTLSLRMFLVIQTTIEEMMVNNNDGLYYHKSSSEDLYLGKQNSLKIQVKWFITIYIIKRFSQFVPNFDNKIDKEFSTKIWNYVQHLYMDVQQFLKLDWGTCIKEIVYIIATSLAAMQLWQRWATITESYRYRYNIQSHIDTFWVYQRVFFFRFFISFLSFS